MIFISTATSFSLASIFNVFFDSTNDKLLPPFAVRNAMARFLVDGDDDSDDDADAGFRSDDAWRRCFDGDADDGFDDFMESCLTLFSANGTFDILLMPSFLLRFCALSKILYRKMEKCTKKIKYTCEMQITLSNLCRKRSS